MADVVMPRLSESMEEGTILRWRRRAGDEVRRGDELAEIETDKATVTYEADADGVLEIVAEEGETLPVGSVIARLSAVPAVDGSGNGAQVAPPAGVATSAQPGVPTPALAGPVDDTRAPAAPSAERVMASPLARRIAREQGVELGAVAGSGPGGRVVRADVEASAGASAGAPEPETGSPSPASPAP